ncbi:disulfide bond formation protein B [Candidatus Pelagibacter sp.]|nr:disulfide bond formation protein B [Candidatus Pelagibacter sp.]
MSDQNIKKFYIIILTLSFFSIIAALYVEYILGFKPCMLCIYQRIPYAIAILISLSAFLIGNRNILLIILGLTFLAGILLSGYHVSIEKGIIEPLFSCTGENIKALEKEEILKSLNNIQPDCKDVDFSIFGISLATLNFIISFVLTIVIVYIFKYAKK